MCRYGSSVMFFLGSRKISGLATSDPLAQATLLDQASFIFLLCWNSEK